MNTPTLAQALAQAHTLGLARIDAQLLLLHTVGRAGSDRAWLLAHDTDALAPAEHAHFLALCQRRMAGEPVAYLTGHKEFYGLVLQVDARVLDPRPDTETLVDWALEVIAPLPHDRDAALQAVKGVVGKYHYSAFGGAPLLGVEGVCIICHGSSKDRAIANALGLAALDVRVKLNEKIVAGGSGSA